MSINQWVGHQQRHADAQCVAVLTSPPPDVDAHDAASVAQLAYGYDGLVKPLGGERDKNYWVASSGRPPIVLKFINPAETVEETDLQIKVLYWLAHSSSTHRVHMPQAVITTHGQDVFLFQKNNQLIRVRAYTFVAGDSVLGLKQSHQLYGAFGEVAAQMAVALAGFDHPALARVLSWDVMHLMQLTPWLTEIDLDDTLKQQMTAYLSHFELSVLPRLRQLPQQVIHGDLSKSNIVVSAENPNHIQGVLDFGDLCKGPRVVELAIAASYAIDESTQAPQALQQVIAGYETVLPLSVAERGLLADLVRARLIQRIVISTWRADKFPNNQAYILRATQQAVALITQFFNKQF